MTKKYITSYERTRGKPRHTINDWEMQRREEYDYFILEYLEDEAYFLLEDDPCNYLVLESTYYT